MRLGPWQVTEKRIQIPRLCIFELYDAHVSQLTVVKETGGRLLSEVLGSIPNVALVDDACEKGANRRGSVLQDLWRNEAVLESELCREVAEHQDAPTNTIGPDIEPACASGTSI